MDDLEKLKDKRKALNAEIKAAERGRRKAEAERQHVALCDLGRDVLHAYSVDTSGDNFDARVSDVRRQLLNANAADSQDIASPVGTGDVFDGPVSPDRSGVATPLRPSAGPAPQGDRQSEGPAGPVGLSPITLSYGA
jgi:hypothetical protein